MAKKVLSPWNMVRSRPQQVLLCMAAAPGAGPSIVHRLAATCQHSRIPMAPRRAAGARACVSLAGITRLTHEVGSATPEKDQQPQGRIKRWVTGGEEQMQTSLGACNKIPLVAAALARRAEHGNGTETTWDREEVALRADGQGSREGHAEPAGASGPIGWTHCWLFAGHHYFTSSQSPPCVRGHQPFRVGEQLPCPLTTYLCSQNTLSRAGATSQTPWPSSTSPGQPAAGPTWLCPELLPGLKKSTNPARACHLPLWPATPLPWPG